MPGNDAHAALQMLPGKWPVSDFLVDRATEDYDMMLSLNASEIEAIKNKVITFRLLFSVA